MSSIVAAVFSLGPGEFCTHYESRAQPEAPSGNPLGSFQLPSIAYLVVVILPLHISFLLFVVLPLNFVRSAKIITHGVMPCIMPGLPPHILAD